jgi:flagellar protein FlbB
MMKELEIEKEENVSKIQWFLFVIVIPLLFAIALTLVITTIAGMNVFDVAKKYGTKIPGVSQLVGGTEKSTEQILKENILEQKATIEEKTMKIKKLEQEIENKQNQIDSLKQEIERLNAELSAKQEEAAQPSSNEKQPTVQDIAKMYETMSEKNAADIISRMSDNDAINILASLNSEKAAAILEKMNPANAAKYTTLLTKRAEANTVQ